MKQQTTEKNIDLKIQALRDLMNSLDSMSTVKETAFTIVRG
jgi:hypothetical protein